MACFNFPHHFSYACVEYLPVVWEGELSHDYMHFCNIFPTSTQTFPLLLLSTWLVLNHLLKCSLEVIFHGLPI